MVLWSISIRNPEFNRLELIEVSDDNSWSHYTRDAGDDEYTEVSDSRLILGLGRENHLLLIAFEDWGMLFVNGELASRLELSHNLDYGNVSAVGGFYYNRTGEIHFSNFNVWTP